MQMMSDSINELAAALSKAQGEIKGAAKDRVNPGFKSKYADLASVWDACRAPLTKNGLAVFQTTAADSGDTVLITTLAHSSGQFMRSMLPVRPVKNDPQGMGSALTYCRRYSLSAIVGVAPDDDDDGNAASAKDTGDDRRQEPRHAPPAAADDKIRDDARRLGSAIKVARSHEECDAILSDPAMATIKAANAKTYEWLLSQDSQRRAVLDAIPMAAE